MGTLEGYVHAWRRRFAREEAEARARAEGARRFLDHAVDVLKRHGATKVVLFGSLLSDSFRTRSDIDLAVEGIPGESFTRALADLIMAADWPIDLKRLEEADQRFRAHVLAKGTILYEAT